MDLHEYQSKQLLTSFNIPVLPGFIAYTPREAQKAAVNLNRGGYPVCVVKAQVHAGGRGKAGGVKIAKSPEEAFSVGDAILGMTLVSPQTGPGGVLVKKVWVEAGANIQKEYYLSLVVDRERACVSIIASAEGGMDIEDVAHNTPEKIITVSVSEESGFQDFHGRRIAHFMNISREDQKSFGLLLKNLYLAFRGLDASMLEINPLIRTTDGKFICLDAKMSIDDNALFRQKKAFNFLDYDEIDEREIRASEVGINYIALDGNIGCMVNGAGLAMATMDIIKQAGGEPANFLDVGGGATKEQVTEAFQLILQDKSVKGVLVNIFGGIMRCDVIAAGIIEAAKTLNITVPVVVRLQGTNVDQGKEMLAKSGLKIIPADDMDEAATKIVNAVK
ncbi:MAG TPA: ADP-forming succinate--CoA ligase subunit beta [Oligoflexia bacterium]|nr:ADP-forming succinate--CoA ligase subunit beta [Oligoflexia bacterium]HMP47960.1 ADP-forming succinate--CoA ligase subunit beta [Oligoflexia bacterium]